MGRQSRSSSSQRTLQKLRVWALCIANGELLLIGTGKKNDTRLPDVYMRRRPPPSYLSLLFLHNTMVSLEVLRYTMSPLVLGQTIFLNNLSSPDCEVVVWRVDVKLPSRSALRLRNVTRCWRDSGQPPPRRGVPDGAGLSYSLPIGCQSPTLPPRLGSAVALFTSGCSGLRRRAWRG